MKKHNLISGAILTIMATTPAANALLCSNVMTDAEAEAAALTNRMEDIRKAGTEKVNSKLDQAFNALKEKQCGDMMVNEMSLLDNPFVYIDPNASAANCGLGFELPGLPKIGGTGGFNIDLCQAVKSVAGDTMEKINQQMADWRDKAIDKATNAADEALSGATGGAVDSNGVNSGNIDQALGGHGIVDSGFKDRESLESSISSEEVNKILR